MISTDKFRNFLRCIDDYMIHTGKREIDEMEANRQLSNAGILPDEESNPGEPLRKVLSELRDANLLPHNISQRYGAWKIKLSGTLLKGETFYSFA